MMDADRYAFFQSLPVNRIWAMNVDEIVMEHLTPDAEGRVSELIRRNLAPYEEAGSVLASTFRRLENLVQVYSQPGCQYLVAKASSDDSECIGGAGIGPLHGLPASEGLGEVRDLVLDKQFRGQGIGKRLLKRCVEDAREMGYKRLYLETTPQMEKAQKLFVRSGFRAVTHAQEEKQNPDAAVPCYFILEDLSKEPG